MSDYLALCARLQGNELVAAECENLTGGSPEPDGFALCQKVEHIVHGAYIHTGLQLIAQAPTFEGLLQAVQAQSFQADDFRIEYQKLSQVKQLDSRRAAIELANVIPAFPNLEAPRHRFLLLERDQGLWLGEILTESSHSYEPHVNKPYRTSASLPARLARALVNLVSPPARTILDPCCGTGTILLEAQALGLAALGIDWNPRMVGMSRRNLAHFGYPAEVICGDFLETQRTAGAILTDLPYGRYMHEKSENLQAIIQHAHALAPVAVFVLGEDRTEWFQQAGYRSIKVYQVQKHRSFSRYVHLARSGSLE